MKISQGGVQRQEEKQGGSAQRGAVGLKMTRFVISWEAKRSPGSSIVAKLRRVFGKVGDEEKVGRSEAKALARVCSRMRNKQVSWTTPKRAAK